MAKRLTVQAQIKRLRDAGYSRKDIARVTGSSVSAVGRAERGQTSGASIAAPVREFLGLGKRAKASVASGSVSLPSAKPARAPRPKRIKEAIAPIIVSPLARAEGKLAVMDGDSIVVVHLTMKSTGASRTLFARGGVEVGEIRGRLQDAIERQADKQGRGNQGGISDPLIDWNDVVDIPIEEY